MPDNPVLFDDIAAIVDANGGTVIATEIGGTGFGDLTAVVTKQSAKPLAAIQLSLFPPICDLPLH